MEELKKHIEERIKELEEMVVPLDAFYDEERNQLDFLTKLKVALFPYS